MFTEENRHFGQLSPTMEGFSCGFFKEFLGVIYIFFLMRCGEMRCIVFMGWSVGFRGTYVGFICGFLRLVMWIEF